MSGPVLCRSPSAPGIAPALPVNGARNNLAAQTSGQTLVGPEQMISSVVVTPGEPRDSGQKFPPRWVSSPGPGSSGGRRGCREGPGGAEKFYREPTPMPVTPRDRTSTCGPRAGWCVPSAARTPVIHMTCQRSRQVAHIGRIVWRSFSKRLHRHKCLTCDNVATLGQWGILRRERPASRAQWGNAPERSRRIGAFLSSSMVLDESGTQTRPWLTVILDDHSRTAGTRCSWASRPRHKLRWPCGRRSGAKPTRVGGVRDTSHLVQPAAHRAVWTAAVIVLPRCSNSRSASSAVER